LVVSKHPLTRLLFAISCLLSLALAAIAAPPPSTRPSTQPATQPATTRVSIGRPSSTRPTTSAAAEARAHARRLRDLTAKSIKLLNEKKYPEAESALAEAIQLDPEEPTNLYNMACLLALTHRPDESLKFLEKSVEAGFLDFQHITKDSDLDSLHDDARYQALIAKKDYYQRKAADAVIAALKKQFGNDYLYEIDETDKLIFATNTDRPTLEALKQNLLRQAHSQWDQIFEHKPDQYISVVLPSPRDYKGMAPPGVEGFYNHEARMLIAKGFGFVTQHEFTHALHSADLDPLGQEHPIWLMEGMAVLFEHAEYEKDEEGKEVLTPKDNARLDQIQKAARSNRLVPLEKLFKMKQPEFVGERVLVCYAESGSVMHYLYDQKLLRKFYDTFKATYEKDKTARTALEQTVGKPLDEFEADWKAWMLKRVPPAMMAAKDGPFLGVAFGRANDGMKVQTLVRGGPGAKSGLQVGDVIIAMDGVEARDEMSFMPMLAEHKPGDTVILRLRRQRAYLEVPVVLGRRDDPIAGAASRPGKS
jgi:tetratricopeptide (TPR) repeat protein